MKHSKFADRKSSKKHGLPCLPPKAGRPPRIKAPRIPPPEQPHGQQRGQIQFRRWSVDSHSANRFGKWTVADKSRPHHRDIPRPTRRDVLTLTKPGKFKDQPRYLRTTAGNIVRTS